MNKYMMIYPKHKIDALPFKYTYYLNKIFSYYDKSYMVTKISYEKNLVKDFRFLCYFRIKIVIYILS